MALKEVVVVSHHTRTVTDKHHGIEYTFEPGQKTQIPMAAAVHLFGLGLADRSPAWKRAGFTQSDKGGDFLKKFDLKVVDLVAADSNVIEELQAAHEEKIGALTEEFGKQTEQLQQEHNDEIEAINQRHADELAALKGEAPAPASKTAKRK